MESPEWAVRPSARGSISPAPGWPTANDGDGERGKNEDRMSPFSSQADKFWLAGREGPGGGDRDDEDSLGGDYRVSDEKFLPRSGSRGRDAGASAREAWGEGTRDSNSADAQSRRAEAEWQRFRRSGLTTAEEREAELLATAGDLKVLNEELQVELQRERQRTADLVHKADRMARELDTERMERKKYERESTHKARELSWAHSLIQELRSQIDDTTHRDESQAKVQTELLTLLEQQVHDGDKVVKELQESLVKSELEIDVLRRDATAASEARAAAEESNQKLRMAAAEDQRKTRILIKYKENAQKQMTQQHEAVLKKLFDSAALLDRESSDDVEAGGILGTAWPRGSSPLKRELEAEARSEAQALGGRRSSGDTSWRKEAGGMKSYTELRMDKEASERKLRLAQRQLKLVVFEHSKLIEKHRMITATKDTLLEELKTVTSAANVMESDLREQLRTIRTQASHHEREAIFERESRARVSSECSWLREKLRSLYQKTEQLNQLEGQRGSDRDEVLRALKVREREMESMIQMMQGLAQDMWLKMEAEAKNMWAQMVEYRSGLEQLGAHNNQATVQGQQQWVSVYQTLGKLLREFESRAHDRLVQNAAADVREAIHTDRSRKKSPAHKSMGRKSTSSAAQSAASPEKHSFSLTGVERLSSPDKSSSRPRLTFASTSASEMDASATDMSLAAAAAEKQLLAAKQLLARHSPTSFLDQERDYDGSFA